MIRLRTFGAVALEREEIPLTGRNTQRRRLALLVLVACARRKPVSRDRVLALLWPERDADRGRHVLAQLVYELRRDLGRRALIGGVDDLALDSTFISSDVADFEDAFERGSMQRAAALYRGPFLDGFFVSEAAEFERWAEARRSELATKYLHALETLAIAAADRGDLVNATEYRRRAATFDPLSTRHALALMQSLARVGDRPAAIRHAQVHAQLLRCELETEPDSSITELAAELSRQSATLIAPRDLEQPAVASSVVPPLQLESRPTAGVASEERATRARPYWLQPRRRAFVPLTAAGLFLLGAVVLRARRPDAEIMVPRLVVLGDIATSDTGLSLAVREAIRAELERTSDVVVLGDGAVASTLRLMKLEATTRLTEAVADDVALRAGAPLVIVGRVTSLGTPTEIVTRLVDPRHATTLAVFSTTPLTTADVVPGAAHLAEQLRERVSRVAVMTSTPLPVVTTSSLEALRDYGLARAALARVDRPAAIAFAEAAVTHDSDFALAHYLLGDLLWYVDKERHAEAHLERAYALSARLPPRERLLVQARYTQLVLDRPDSALAFWRQLRAAYPGEPLGYEGAVWADLAIGAYGDAAAAADSALRLDSTAAPQVRNRMLALLALGDTARALTLTRTAGARWPYLEQQTLIATYQMRADWRGLEHFIDSIAPPIANGRPNLEMAPTRQTLLLSLGRVRAAQTYADLVVAKMHAQFAIRAQLYQAGAELALGGSRRHARALLKAAVTRLDSTDLSPPATARLAELAAGVAAAAADEASIAALHRIIVDRDMGRRLRSHELAQLTVTAAESFVRGDYATAVLLLERTRTGLFFGRSQGTLALLEAGALSRLGERARADSLYRLTSMPGSEHEDVDTWMALRPAALRGLERSRLASTN